MQFRALCFGGVLENGIERLPRDISLTFSRGPFEALEQLRAEPFDVVLAHFPVADWTPELLLENVLAICRTAPVIICKADATVDEAVRLVKLGAFEITADSGLDESVHRALEAVRAAASAVCLPAEPWRKLLVGGSLKMQRIIDMVRLVANRRCTVLITGETGTGKEVIARAIHFAGNRAAAPLVCVNCNALPDTLLEAELFGHVKGAFTGAMSNRVGRFEQAHRGTLFLDEIGDLPLGLQAKLLRVLQEREFQRLGSSEDVRVDVRVIAATNCDLTAKMSEGKFREDLYYRLNVVPLNAPALRERPEDIPLLTRHFAERVCREEGIAVKQVSPEVTDRLMRYDWPGNVRQLENAVEMAVALSGCRELLVPSDFPLPACAPLRPAATAAQPFVAVPDQGLDFERTVGSIERDILEQALQKTRGNKKAAAQMLRLKRTTLSAKLKTLSAAAAV